MWSDKKHKIYKEVSCLVVIIAYNELPLRENYLTVTWIVTDLVND